MGTKCYDSSRQSLYVMCSGFVGCYCITMQENIGIPAMTEMVVEGKVLVDYISLSQEIKSLVTRTL